MDDIQVEGEKIDKLCIKIIESSAIKSIDTYINKYILFR